MTVPIERDRVEGLIAKIYNGAGAYLGDVTDIWDWSALEPMSEAGEFEFTCWSTAANRALLIEGYRADLWADFTGSGGVDLSQFSSGTIRGISPQFNGGGTSLRIKGWNRLFDLARRTIPFLEVKEQAWNELTGQGGIRQIRISAGIWYDIDLTGAYDGNPATNSSFVLHDIGYDPSFLYIGCDQRFTKIAFTVVTGNTDLLSTSKVQYMTESSGWGTITLSVDSTVTGASTLTKSGNYEFTAPSDWIRSTPTGAAGSQFWIRIGLDPGGHDETSVIVVSGITVYMDQPTTNALNLIMAYAPAGWTTSGYSATAAAFFIVKGVSVLEALNQLRKQIGGHFISGQVGGSEKLNWFTAFTDSGFTAKIAPVDVAADELLIVGDPTKDTDLMDLVTRVYPQDRDGINLSLTSRTASSPYSLSTASNYIRNATLEASIGIWGRSIRFPELFVQQTDSRLIQPEYVADALFDTALNWLMLRDKAAEFYSVAITGLVSLLHPTGTIHVTASYTVQGITVGEIDDDLIMTKIRHYIDEAGFLAAELSLSTMEREALDDSEIVASAILEFRAASAAGGSGSGSSALGGAITLGQGADIRISGYTISRAGSGILLYSGSGGELVEYARSSVGLAAAVAAAVAGDIIQLPDGKITASISVPASVCLRGLGWESIIAGTVTLAAGASAEHLRVEQSVDSSTDILGIIGPTSGEATIRDVCVRLYQAGAGKALGLLSNGGTLRAYECQVWVNAAAGSAWGYAATTDGVIEMNQGQVRAWRTI